MATFDYVHVVLICACVAWLEQWLSKGGIVYSITNILKAASQVTVLTRLRSIRCPLVVLRVGTRRAAAAVGVAVGARGCGAVRILLICG